MLLYSALSKSIKSLSHSLGLNFFIFYFHFLLYHFPLPILPSLQHTHTCTHMHVHTHAHTQGPNMGNSNKEKTTTVKNLCWRQDRRECSIMEEETITGKIHLLVNIIITYWLHIIISICSGILMFEYIYFSFINYICKSLQI